jgi:uncharacterized protein YigE (DUF2233 family)
VWPKVKAWFSSIPWKRAAGGVVAATTLAFAVWQTLPDKSREDFLAWSATTTSSWFRRVNKVDVKVDEFVVNPKTAELAWPKQKLERNFVDLFIDSGLTVASTNTANQKLDKSHYVLSGMLVKDSKGNYEITVELQDNSSTILGQSTLNASKKDFETLYKVVPAALLYGMQIELPSLKRALHPEKSRPTQSVLAYAFFLEAKRQGRSHDYNGAEQSLRQAIDFDPSFACAMWALAELEERRGEAEDASVLRKKAAQVNPDHPRLSVLPGDETRPMPALFAEAQKASPIVTGNGLLYRRLAPPERNLKVHIWTFDREHFVARIEPQSDVKGNVAEQFLREPKDVLAVNGGFFEIEPDNNNLGPSGLFTVKGQEVQGVNPKAGSGVLAINSSGPQIERSAQYSAANFIDAVQSGPILVEPGGKNGIFKNDFDRQNRTAICLRGATFDVVIVEGGLSLYELAEFLSAKQGNGGLECNAALNLDGGPSTQAFFRGDQAETEIAGRWKIQNALVVSSR